MAGDIYYNNVSLLLHCDGTDGSTTFNDNSPTPKTVTANGDARVDTAKSKFGGASALFDGTGDYLSIPSSTDFIFGSGDFTVEAWVNFSSTPDVQYIVAKYNVTSQRNWALRLIATSKINFLASTDGITVDLSMDGTTTILVNTWYHVAITRDGDTFRLFLDGAQEATASLAGALFTETNAVTVGGRSDDSFRMAGNVDDVRVSKGIARYTTNFTPPTVAFPDTLPPNNSLVGSIPVGFTIATIINRKHNVVGSVAVNHSVVSTLHKQLIFTVIGNIPLIITPTISHFHSIIQDVVITNVVAAVLKKYHQSTMVGETTITTSINAVMLKVVNSSIVGSILVTVGVSAPILLLSKTEILQNTIGLTTTSTYDLYVTLNENIGTLLSLSSQSNSKYIVLENLRLLDKILISLNGIISETLNLSSTHLDILIKVETILELISTITQITNSSVSKSIILELVSIIDSVLFNKALSISETMGLQDSLVLLQKGLNTVLEQINLITSTTGNIIKIGIISDSLDLLPSFSSVSSFINAISEQFIISIPGVTSQDTYLAYVFNTETNSISTYNNYNFNTSTLFNGKYIFGSSTGLYEYGGSKDNLVDIQASLKTVAYNFGTSNLKQIPEMYIGGTNSDSMIIKVRVDNKAEVYYKIKNTISSLHTQRIKFGKGLIGRYFQFELITSSDECDLESIEFYPIILNRKI